MRSALPEQGAGGKPVRLGVGLPRGRCANSSIISGHRRELHANTGAHGARAQGQGQQWSGMAVGKEAGRRWRQGREMWLGRAAEGEGREGSQPGHLHMHACTCVSLQAGHPRHTPPPYCASMSHRIICIRGTAVAHLMAVQRLQRCPWQVTPLRWPFEVRCLCAALSQHDARRLLQYLLCIIYAHASRLAHIPRRCASAQLLCWCVRGRR